MGEELTLRHLDCTWFWSTVRKSVDVVAQVVDVCERGTLKRRWRLT